MVPGGRYKVSLRFKRSSIFRSYLSDDERIGRRETIGWPARSPDMTPLDYFFCLQNEAHAFR